ncbi:MAG TPA: hypothetical protein DCZ76_03955 [Treponema sp.]|nr:hypothetical protein [Treponema sp.]
MLAKFLLDLHLSSANKAYPRLEGPAQRVATGNGGESRNPGKRVCKLSAVQKIQKIQKRQNLI